MCKCKPEYEADYCVDCAPVFVDRMKYDQLVAENGRLRSALKGLLDCIQETRGCDATDAVWKAREALKESK